MKKILLGLVLLLTTATMSAQVELEKTVADCSAALPAIQFVGMDNYFVLRDMDGKDYGDSGGYYQYYIYNENMDLVKTLRGAVSDRIIALTKNVFTTDGKFCYITYDEETKITIFDEDHKTLLLIPNVDKWHFKQYYYYYGSSDANKAHCIRKISNEYKLFIPIEGGISIYSCPGNGETSTSVENVPAKIKRNAYPNPATDLVTLPYEANGATSMKIYDMQGKLVERKFLDKSKQELQLNVKNYPTGMYFFEVNGESNSFVVE